jgi:hypothetical protein
MGAVLSHSPRHTHADAGAHKLSYVTMGKGQKADSDTEWTDRDGSATKAAGGSTNRRHASSGSRQRRLLYASATDSRLLDVPCQNKPLAVAVYMVTFTAFVLFMLINLLLAIIVESYMDTKKALQTISKECSQSLIEDLIAVAQLTVNRYIFGWPAHSDLTMALEDLTPDAEGYVHEADFNKSEKLRITDSAGDKPQACQFENPLGMFTRDNEGPTEDSDEPNAIFDFYHSFQFLRSKLDDSKEQDTAARFRKRATHSSSNLMSTNDEGEGLDDEGLDDDDDNDNPLNLPDTM